MPPSKKRPPVFDDELYASLLSLNKGQYRLFLRNKCVSCGNVLPSQVTGFQAQAWRCSTCSNAASAASTTAFHVYSFVRVHVDPVVREAQLLEQILLRKVSHLPHVDVSDVDAAVAEFMELNGQHQIHLLDALTRPTVDKNSHHEANVADLILQVSSQLEHL
jgi:hypothetical protein